MSKWEMRKTLRGFARMEFPDQYGQECSVQQSSLATESCIWFGVDKTHLENKAGDCHRMHLSIDDVKKLLPHLVRFVNTEELADGHSVEMSKDTIRETFTAPTESEVAGMISVLSEAPGLQNTARCLAFERDTLKRERDQLADALVSANDLEFKDMEEPLTLARKIIAAREAGR